MQLQKTKYLYQEDVVYQIEKKFGRAFVYDNENGNPAIEKKVLAAFRKLSGEQVVWERGERCWRYREKYDQQGSRMQE